jgi:hypothetical protein
MPELKGAIPELISFILGLILSFLSVPSIIDIGIKLISTMNQAFPSTMSMMPILYIIALRILGWSVSIGAILRIIIHFQKREYVYL